MLGGFFLSIAILISSSCVYIVFGKSNVKKVVSLSILQSSLIALFLSIGYVKNSIPPIIQDSATDIIYTDPVPSVLMLTAIVVGFCISALGYAFLIKIKQMEADEKPTDDDIKM